MAPPPEYARRSSRSVQVGSVRIGGKAPISVQSMTTTHTRDTAATLAQIRLLAAAGCDLVRVAVPALPDAEALHALVEAAPVPLIADIHFSTALALRALEAGAAKIRLNPGNTDDREGLAQVFHEAARRGRPVRFGVNSGSVLAKASGPAATGADLARLMVDTLMEWVGWAEKEGLTDVVLSAKASDVPTTIAAYRLLAEACDLPLHLGVTAAGPADDARLRSAICLGTLLAEGIGDTVRVSLTGDPVREVVIAQDILSELGLRPRRGVRIVSCPTCGRCEVDLVSLVERLKEELAEIEAPLTVAVMGCIVNGPGEAREADVGIAAGKGHGVLFRRGEPVRKVPEAELLGALLKEVHDLTREQDGPRT